MYHNQTLHNLQSCPSLPGAFTHESGIHKNNITVTYGCTAHVDDPDSAGSFANGPSLTGASTNAVGIGNEYITVTYDCTVYSTC